MDLVSPLLRVVASSRVVDQTDLTRLVIGGINSESWVELQVGQLKFVPSGRLMSLALDVWGPDDRSLLGTPVGRVRAAHQSRSPEPEHADISSASNDLEWALAHVADVSAALGADRGELPERKSARRGAERNDDESLENPLMIATRLIAVKETLEQDRHIGVRDGWANHDRGLRLEFIDSGLVVVARHDAGETWLSVGLVTGSGQMARVFVERALELIEHDGPPADMPDPASAPGEYLCAALTVAIEHARDLEFALIGIRPD